MNPFRHLLPSRWDARHSEWWEGGMAIFGAMGGMLLASGVWTLIANGSRDAGRPPMDALEGMAMLVVFGTFVIAFLITPGLLTLAVIERRSGWTCGLAGWGVTGALCAMPTLLFVYGSDGTDNGMGMVFATIGFTAGAAGWAMRAYACRSIRLD